MATQRLKRFQAELSMLAKNPPPGITCRHDEANPEVIIAEISGPPESAFEKGTFTVEISLSDRYPFTPPNAKFVTPVYHPNVDTTGRICLSGLKPKPAGSWNCSMNIAVILSAIRLLLSEPNLGDPLMSEIAAEYQDNFSTFQSKAQAKTLQYAIKLNKGQDPAENISRTRTMDGVVSNSSLFVPKNADSTDESDASVSVGTGTIRRSKEKEFITSSTSQVGGGKSLGKSSASTMMPLTTVSPYSLKSRRDAVVPSSSGALAEMSDIWITSDESDNDDFQELIEKQNPPKKPKLKE